MMGEGGMQGSNRHIKDSVSSIGSSVGSLEGYGGKRGRKGMRRGEYVPAFKRSGETIRSPKGMGERKSGDEGTGSMEGLIRNMRRELRGWKRN